MGQILVIFGLLCQICLPLGQLRARLRQTAPCVPDHNKLPGQSGVIVQQCPVATWVQKPAIIVLTVKFHKAFRNLAQDLALTAPVIDKALFAPVAPGYPPHHQFVV